MSDYIGEIVAVAILIAINGWFAAAEIALVSARRTALQAAADKGSKGARAALRLLEDPTRLLSTIQVGITLVGFAAASTAAVSLSKPVAEWLGSLGVTWIGRVSSGAAILIVTLAITYLTLVFGELAPKRLGLQRAERVAAFMARPVAGLSVVLAPLVWVLARSTDVVARLMGVKGTGGKPGVSEEEIKLLVTEQGTLLDEEKRMIHEVLEMGDTVAREIMVPRVDMEMLEDTMTTGEALPEFQRTGLSRMPVFHEDADTIVGVALLKDVVRPVVEGRRSEPVTDHLRQPFFVPETKGILGLLSDMRGTSQHMAIVVDEHGGTAGLVTIEDIVEEVIGEIDDEYDREHRFISEAGEGRWVVDGRLSVEEARERLGLDIPESDEYETIAGWVLMELGHIPDAGEALAYGRDELRVLAVRQRRIARLMVTRASGSDEEDG